MIIEKKSHNSLKTKIFGETRNEAPMNPKVPALIGDALHDL